MRKLLITSFLISIFNFCFGQFSSKNPPLKSYSPWSIGLAVKSSFEDITTDRALQDSYDFNYNPKFSFELELFAEKRMNNNWYLNFGINYHQLSLEYDYKIPIFFDKTGLIDSENIVHNKYEMVLNNSFERLELSAIAEYTLFNDGNDYKNGAQLDFRVRSVNRIAYIGIPVSLKKEFGNRRLRFTTKVGIEPAGLIKSKIDYNYYHQSGMHIEGSKENYKYRGEEFSRVELKELDIKNQISYLQIFQVNGFLNIGFIHSYKYHSFFMESEFKRSLTSFSQRNTTSYLQSLGFRTGVIKRFAASKVIDMSKRRPKFNW